MAVDPYVPTRPEDAPRRSVAVPPAQGWRAVRPGDLEPGWPGGCFVGSPAPDAGYALTLAQRFHDRLAVVPPETAHDAEMVASEVAMKRAGLFGRAPVKQDLEVAFTLFGWLGEAPADLVEWRRFAVAGMGENYFRRRALVDRVSRDVLRRSLEEIRQGLPRWQDVLPTDPEPPPVR
jgi:hypothetical protein